MRQDNPIWREYVREAARHERDLIPSPRVLPDGWPTVRLFGWGDVRRVVHRLYRFLHIEPRQ